MNLDEDRFADTLGCLSISQEARRKRLASAGEPVSEGAYTKDGQLSAGEMQKTCASAKSQFYFSLYYVILYYTILY